MLPIPINRWTHRGILHPAFLLIAGATLVFAPRAEARIWTSRAEMPTPRGYLAAAVVAGKIYTLGGSLGGITDPTATRVEVYDPAADTWSPKADIPQPRTTIAAAALAGQIYVVGSSDFTAGQALFAYDPATDTWTQKADMPAPRGQLGLAAAAGKLYAIGGWDGVPQAEGYLGLASVFMYDPATDTWTRKADMPLPSIWLLDGVCVVGDKIYVMGLCSETYTAPIHAVCMYDPATDTWAQKADMLTNRVVLATAVVANKLYAIGGGRAPNAGAQGVVEAYDPATDRWSGKDLAALNMPRAGAAAAAVAGKIYVFGGFTDRGVPIATVEAFDPRHPIVRNAPTFFTIAGTPSLPLSIEIQLELSAGAPPPGLSLDLRAFGHHALLALAHQGTGRYTGQTTITPPDHNGGYPLPLLLHPAGTPTEAFFDLQLAVLPAEDMPLFDQTLAPSWSLTTNKRVTVTPTSFDGRAGLALEAHLATAFALWRLSLTPAEPIDLFGYEALSFAFHPATATPAGSAPHLQVGGVDVLDQVELSRPQWQRVILAKDRDLPTGSRLGQLQFSGNLTGTFYLGDIRLVAQTPPQPTVLLEVQQNSNPAGLTLDQNQPNPFNSGTLIRFALPRSGRVNLTVYNSTGQRVAALVNDWYEAGTYAVTWDGHGSQGQALASGVYLYRLQAGDRIQTRKLALIR